MERRLCIARFASRRSTAELTRAHYNSPRESSDAETAMVPRLAWFPALARPSFRQGSSGFPIARDFVFYSEAVLNALGYDGIVRR